MYMVQEFSVHGLQEQVVYFFTGSPTILRLKCARSPEINKKFLRLNELGNLALTKHVSLKDYRSNTFPRTLASLEELKAAVQCFLVAAKSGRLKVHCNLHFCATVQFCICVHDSTSPISSFTIQP